MIADSRKEEMMISEANLTAAFQNTFTRTIGDALPIIHPNVRPGCEVEDLDMIINENRPRTSTWAKLSLASVTVLPLIRLPFATHLIETITLPTSMRKPV